MFKTIKNAFKTPDVRKRILYTLLLIVIFRLGCYITVPGVNSIALNEAMGTNNGVAGLIDMISGGAFSRFSVFAMSISPYITASIVIQLLGMIIPSLERLTNLCASDYEFIPSADYLCCIHKYLFESIYEFAGVYREVEIFKETEFLKPELIKEELTKVIKKYNDLEVNASNKFEIARILGEFYRELIYIHPFREGNGRSIREFLREFAEYKFNYQLDYSKIDKKNFLLGITDKNNYPLLLAYEIYNAIEQKEKVR